MDKEKIFSIIPLACAVFIIFLIWKLIEIIIIGIAEANWLMVIAGGILAYSFMALLIITLIACLYFFTIILFD